jgi:hypothetical protein
MSESVIEHVLGRLKIIEIDDIFGAHCGGGFTAEQLRGSSETTHCDCFPGHWGRVSSGRHAGADRRDDPAKTGK